MGKTPPDWYASAFDVRSTQLPWNERTEEDLKLALKILAPRKDEHILDLACGHGRHAIELARRGFHVVGVDLSPEMIQLSIEEAGELDVEFRVADMRELPFAAEFDVVLGFNSPIGYLEDDAENRRAFEAIAGVIRPGGRGLLQIPNVLRAEARPSEKSWSLGAEFAELVERRWDPDTRTVEGAVLPIELLGAFYEPDPIAFRQRLYSLAELEEILGPLGISISGVFDDSGEACEPSSEQLDIFVLAEKG